MWVGAIVVTVNAKLLGGNVSFFQNICLLGYCVAPMIAATSLCMLIHFLLPDISFSCGLGPDTTCLEGRYCCVSSRIVSLAHVSLTRFSPDVWTH